MRCALVVCDPALAASQPAEELAASALNALAHAAEAPCTVGANPVSTLAAHHAARLLVAQRVAEAAAWLAEHAAEPPAPIDPAPGVLPPVPSSVSRLARRWWG